MVKKKAEHVQKTKLFEKFPRVCLRDGHYKAVILTEY